MKKTILITIVAVLITCSSFAQIITTIAGTGSAGYSGDGLSATAARLSGPAHIAFDNSGNIFFTDYYNNAIRKIDLAGTISTVAGTGSVGYFGDGGPATAAKLNGPNGMILDTAGSIYFADAGNNVIRKITTAGIISTVAGNGAMGFSGDGGAATAAKLKGPTGVAVDDSGRIFIADAQNARVRLVNTHGIISTIAGTGAISFSGDGGPATAATCNGPGNLVLGSGSDIYFTDQMNQRVRKVNAMGIISTVAGTGAMGFSGDGGAATAAQLHYPSMIDLDDSGNLIVDDSYNNVIRKVNSAGIITTIAGNSSGGYAGDGGPATAASLNQPFGFIYDVCGNLFIADALNNVIRKVSFNHPLPPITGPASVYTDSTITLSNSIKGGGVWSSGDTTIATVGSTSGMVKGVMTGTVVMTFSNYCNSASYTVTVTRLTTGVANTLNNVNLLSIIPNPTNGTFNLTGSLPDNVSDANIEIIDILGKKVLNDVAFAQNGILNRKITLDKNVPNGIYFIKVQNNAMNQIIRFSLYR